MRLLSPLILCLISAIVAPTIQAATVQLQARNSPPEPRNNPPGRVGRFINWLRDSTGISKSKKPAGGDRDMGKLLRVSRALEFDYIVQHYGGDLEAAYRRCLEEQVRTIYLETPSSFGRLWSI